VKRYLVPGLLVEGRTDDEFLRPVIQRQLEELGREYGFDVQEILTDLDGCRTVRAPNDVDRAVGELLNACHLVCVHHDRREASKIDALQSRVCDDGRIVAVVPVRETEAWVLAALASASVPGADLTVIPQPLKCVEQEPTPKDMLRRALPGRDVTLALRDLGTRVDLGVLRQLDAYGTFVGALIATLEKLSFL
jgi:hypothetical protein